jgi:hypothetical protein
MEVNVARVFNWDVMMRRREDAEQGASEDKGKKVAPNG